MLSQFSNTFLDLLWKLQHFGNEVLYKAGPLGCENRCLFSSTIQALGGFVCLLFALDCTGQDGKTTFSFKNE